MRRSVMLRRARDRAARRARTAALGTLALWLLWVCWLLAGGLLAGCTRLDTTAESGLLQYSTAADGERRLQVRQPAADEAGTVVTLYRLDSLERLPPGHPELSVSLGKQRDIAGSVTDALGRNRVKLLLGAAGIAFIAGGFGAMKIFGGWPKVGRRLILGGGLMLVIALTVDRYAWVYAAIVAALALVAALELVQGYRAKEREVTLS